MADLIAEKKFGCAFYTFIFFGDFITNHTICGWAFFTVVIYSEEIAFLAIGAFIQCNALLASILALSAFTIGHEIAIIALLAFVH